MDCCCPCWADTVTGNWRNGKPPRVPEKGVRVPTRLATGDSGHGGNEDGGLAKESGKIFGQFYENDKITQSGRGKAKLCLES